MINTTNNNITLSGNKITLIDNALKIGEKAPEFKVTDTALKDWELSSLAGQSVIIASIPSVDTPVCALEIKEFSKKIAENDKLKLVSISMDLPFALKRWCGAENVSNIVATSDFKYHDFGKKYGVFVDGVGILARAIFVLDKTHKLVHIEYVSEIGQEPNYQEALKVALECV